MPSTGSVVVSLARSCRHEVRLETRVSRSRRSSFPLMRVLSDCLVGVPTEAKLVKTFFLEVSFSFFWVRGGGNRGVRAMLARRVCLWLLWFVMRVSRE